MEEGRLNVTTRLPPGYYFIKRHDLDLREGRIEPESAQLFLKSADEFKHALASAKKMSKQLLAARLATKTGRELFGATQVEIEPQSCRFQSFGT